MVDDSDSSEASLAGLSSGDEDPFYCQPKITGRKKKQAATHESPSSGKDSGGGEGYSSSSSRSSPPKRRGRKPARSGWKRKDSLGVDRKLDQLKRRRAAAGVTKRQRSRSSIDSLLSSSSEDEDEKKPDGRRSVGSRNGTSAQVECIDLNSSSDDDDTPPLSQASVPSIGRRMTRTAARAAAAAADLDKKKKRESAVLGDAEKETVGALQEARRAMEALKEAQKYQAEDVSFGAHDEEEEEDDDDIICVEDGFGGSAAFGIAAPSSAVGSRATGAASAMASITDAPSGQLIRLNVRFMLSSSQVTDERKQMFKIRTGETLQRVVDQMHQSATAAVPESSRVKLLFDGETLNLDKTPTFYDMEDEDLIDAIIMQDTAAGKVCASTTSRRAPPASGSHPSAPVASSARVKIRTRVKGGDPRKVHEFLMWKSDPLRKLIDAYGKLHRESGAAGAAESVTLAYNGRTLNPFSTPGGEGIVDNTMLEINDEDERQAQLQQISRSVSSSPKLGDMVVICRINGDDGRKQKYGIHPTERFESVMVEFCTRNGVQRGNCSFQFDGEQLKAIQTPGQLDLEGDEIIDVVVDESVLAAASKTSSAKPRALVREPTVATGRSTRNSVNSLSVSNTSPQPSEGCSTRKKTPLQPAQSSLSSKAILSLQVKRNNKSSKPKKFKVYSTDKLKKLKDGYKNHYKKRGCRSVEFYVGGEKLLNAGATLDSFGLKDMDTVVAMENGRRYLAS